MARYFVRRALLAVLLVFLVSSASLVLARLAPGDYVTESLGVRASVRGEDHARFVFVESTRRAVEISVCDDGIWVEYWDRADESPRFDRTFAEADAAVASARLWLAGGTG